MTKLLYLLAIVNLISFTSLAQCAEVVQQADKNGNKAIIMTTCLGERSTEPIHYKRISENKASQFVLQLYTQSGALLTQKGAMVVFKDGAKIEWTEACVKSGFKGGYYTSQCEIILTDDLIEQFQEREIAFIKLSGYERALTTHQSQRAKDIINCILFSDSLEIKLDQVVSQ